MNFEIKQGNALDILRSMDRESVQMCVTSPPYFGLRDYGVDGQIGLEETPFDFIDALVDVFREVRRVLKDDGTLWLNLGDTYSAHKDCKSIGQTLAIGTNNENAHVIDKGMSRSRDSKMLKANGFKNKDLMMIPHRVAIALQSDGWYVRSDIVWHKPNPMPESVTDRPTKSHEYIFLLTKSARYYYDAEAIKEPLKDASIAQYIQGYNGKATKEYAIAGVQDPSDIKGRMVNKGRDTSNGNRNGKGASTLDHKNRTVHTMHKDRAEGKEWQPTMAGGGLGVSGHSGYFKENGEPLCGIMANKKSVWTVTTRPFKEAHFATFPEKLIEPCILAGSKEGDVVLDPFNGAGTSGLVSLKNRRNYIGIELKPEYVAISERRLKDVQVKLF